MFYPFPVLLLWLSPCRHWTPHNHSLLPPLWDGGKNWKVKSRKAHGLRKVIFIGKAKAAPTGKADQGICSPLPMDRQVFNHPQKSRTASCMIIFWEGKCHHSTCLFLLLPHRFYCWPWLYLVWTVSPQNFCTSTSSLSLMLCDTVQQ